MSLEIIIGDVDGHILTIGTYLDNYSVNISEKYSDQSGMTTISGKTISKYLGDVRRLSVNFEPMETSQLNEFISTIKYYKNSIPIDYVDPEKGKIQKRFSCKDLPTATYFESDDKRQFWTIPTVTFEETDESAQLDWGRYG